MALEFLTQRAAGSNVARLHAVVIDRVRTDPTEAARLLAAALGKTAYEVRPSVNVDGGGPAVVAVLADLDAATRTAATVRAAGFESTVVPVRDPLPDLVLARKFELGAAVLIVESHESGRVELPYAAVDVLLRGTRQTQSKTTERVTEHKIAIGRAILSGGLVNTRKETTTRTTTTTDSDEFMLVFAGTQVCSLRERELQYQSLGPALQPSRTANFRYLLAELQRCCTHAVRDERLMRRSIQSQILGAMLSPDDHLDFAAMLVATSLRQIRPGGP